MSESSTARHFDGTATTSPANVDVGTGVISILIENLVDTNDLLVSFDGGSKFKTIGTSKSLVLDVATRLLVVKSSAGSVNYEILATVR